MQGRWPPVYSGANSLPYLPSSGINRLYQCTVRAMLCNSLSDAIVASTAATANGNGPVFSPCLCQTRRDGEKDRRKGDTTPRLGVRPPDVAMVKIRVITKRRRDKRCVMHPD